MALRVGRVQGQTGDTPMGNCRVRWFDVPRFGVGNDGHSVCLVGYAIQYATEYLLSSILLGRL